jgi:hypothetical protein
MRNTIVGALVIVGVSMAAVSARQGASVPGPGSGVASVSGSVRVSNAPPTAPGGEWKVTVANAPPAAFRGEWKVEVANVPPVNRAGEWKMEVANKVALASPEFISSRGQYAITWTDGTRETVVAEPWGGEWIRVALPGGKYRFINLSAARYVDQL